MDLSEEEIKQYLESTDFPSLKNERILITAKGGVPDKLPVWVMRQAGRYLTEFRDFRKQHSFFEICRSPKLACEVTLMPIRRYELDAAIIFSDILVVPQALGLEVVMEPEKGPVFPKPLTLDNLKDLDWNNPVEKLQYVGQAIRLTRHMLQGKVPIIGFSAAPWTLMVYMIEGGGTKTASKAKKWIYSNPQQARELFKRLADVIVDYLVMQVEWGAQMLQLFESSAEYLTSDVYEDFMLPLLKQIPAGIRAKLQTKNIPSVPIVFFAKGGRHLLDLQLQANFDVISLDWATDPEDVRCINKDIVLQGNLDPCALYADKETLQKYTTKMLNKFAYKHHIVNLGHGIYPDVDPQAVEWFVETVHAFKNPYP